MIKRSVRCIRRHRVDKPDSIEGSNRVLITGILVIIGVMPIPEIKGTL